jgi:hypothetical protein
VPDAACARFWVEFEFGKWLVPKVEESFDLIHPSLLTTAIECFGVGFAPGGFYA